MTFQDLPLLSGLASRMQYLSARTSVIAENIANADTPNYVARDVAAPDFKTQTRQYASASTMRASDPRHITTSPMSDKNPPRPSPDRAASLSGNAVSVEQETMKLSQTRMEYGMASSVYRKSLDLIRLAISTSR